jgi:FkbM family methyltransferase
VTGNGSPATVFDLPSALAALLHEPLLVIDVGCRWGFADMWETLGDRCVAVGFEPDPEECERLLHHYGNRSSVRIVPHALGARPGPATLHVTLEPACSSLYPPIDDVIDRYPRLESQRLVQTEQIELITLDAWCAENRPGDVDLIKLDTQGSELDVLRGAERVLESVAVVQTEVEFNPLYAGQPLFGDVDRFLRERGFVLWHLDNLAHHRHHGARTSLRPAQQFYDFDSARFTRRAGQLFWADAVFVRAEMTRPDAAIPPEVALRRACLAAALGLTDLAGVALDTHARPLRGEAGRVIENARRQLPPHDSEVERLTFCVRDANTARSPAPRPGYILDRCHVVALDEPIEGAAWHEPERLQGVPVRFTGPGRHAWIDLPFELPPASRVELVIVDAGTGGCYEIAVTVNGARLAMEWAAQARGTLGRAVLPDDYAPASESTRISITTPDPVPRPGIDPRKLGIGVAELRLVPPGDPAY